MNSRTTRVFACLLALAAVGIVRYANAQSRPSFEIMEATIPRLQAALSVGIITSRDLVTMYLAALKPMIKKVRC
jgi:hypothetical protein